MFYAYSAITEQSYLGDGLMGWTTERAALLIAQLFKASPYAVVSW